MPPTTGVPAQTPATRCPSPAPRHLAPASGTQYQQALPCDHWLVPGIPRICSTSIRRLDTPWVIGLSVFALVVSIAAGVAHGDQWTRWQWVNPTPQGFALMAACQGADNAVAVGWNGAILVSEDVQHWEFVELGQWYYMEDVTWNGERYIAVGWQPDALGADHGTVWTSEDGRGWSEVYRWPRRMLTTVHWNGSQALATGFCGGVLLSPDGVQWSEHDFPEEVWGTYVADVAWNGTRYVAVGWDYWSPHRAFILESADGTLWSSVSLEGLDRFDFYSVEWGNGVFVAAGSWWSDGPSVMVSADGIHWQQVPTGLPDSPDFLEFADGRFAGIGLFGRFFLSPDGFEWEAHELETPDQVFDVAWLGDRYLVVGGSGFMASSSDGVTWVEIWRDMLGLSSGVHDLLEDDGMWLGVTGAGVVRSYDGLLWEHQDLDEWGSFHSVRRLEDGFWLVGGNGHIFRGADGVSWEQVHDDPELNFSDIASNGDVRVVVGGGGGAAAVVAINVAGNHWDLVAVPDCGFLRSIAWTGSRFVVVGDDGTVLTSADGESWAVSRLDESISLRRLAWNGERLVAVGHLGQEGGSIATSADGLDWNLQNPAPSLAHVTWTGQEFVAVGGFSILTSRDGLAWTDEQVGYRLRVDCAAGDGDQLIVAGEPSTLLHAVPARRVPRLPTGRVHPGP